MLFPKYLLQCPLEPRGNFPVALADTVLIPEALAANEESYKAEKLKDLGIWGRIKY